MRSIPSARRYFATALLATLGLAPSSILAQSPHFTDATVAVGVDWERSPSAEYAVAQALEQASLVEPIDPAAIATTPLMRHGMPGVAVFDLEGDGDLDVFVTNGPGGDNGLLVNRLAESGELTFEDRADAAGIATTDLDANGVCAGDLDNDGDPDLVVLGRAAPNRLFENLGDGTFSEVPMALGHDTRNHISCSLGDVDGDGRLDLVIANNFDPASLEAIFLEPWALNQPNQLLRNEGGLSFSDVSATSGILDLDLAPEGAGTITWAVSMVDLDLDGDTDIVWADDQGGFPTATNAPGFGVDRGFIRIAWNDGTGHFTDQALDPSTISSSSWMGVGFGDLDCDGRLDVFGSNFGDYHFGSLGMPYALGEQATRYYLAQGAGQFTESLPTEGTAFGWGNAVFDADNDGDGDVVYHGGLEMVMIGLRDNPGVLLENEGCEPGAPQLATTVAPFDGRHLGRNVRGVAIGDLDRDGFVDLVTAANWRVPAALPLLPSPFGYGGVLDATASFLPLFAPTPSGMVWSGVSLENGDLAIELNDGVAGNHGVTIRPLGGIGLTAGAGVNRDGLGTVISFRPRGANSTTALMPITGGSSHLSSHAPEAYFGLGDRPQGRVDVLWPGGTRNRLYGVRANEVIRFPEIPCSIDGELSRPDYNRCVSQALVDYYRAGEITKRELSRLRSSALRAWAEEHR